MDEENSFTAKERDLIRLEFMNRFGSARALQEGILVKRWATGPNKGKPKPNAAVQSMIERGLATLVDDGSHWLRATFTTKGIVALRRMSEDRRALPREEYQHLIDALAASSIEKDADGTQNS